VLSWLTPIGADRPTSSTTHYVARFICLATRTIHLECVEDYATTGFLAAFRRFVSRRGLPSHMYSDNGTNFRGANRELQASFEMISSDPTLQVALANSGTLFPRPHLISGDSGKQESKALNFTSDEWSIPALSLTEFATLLCQIETCLNSRPISSLSDDPSDLSALTLGHFLTGQPLVALSEESVLDVDTNRLSRWQFVQAMQEQIWRSWSKDYLHSLQNRNKWLEPQSDVIVNDLVIVKNPLLPLLSGSWLGSWKCTILVRMGMSAYSAYSQFLI